MKYTKGPWTASIHEDTGEEVVRDRQGIILANCGVDQYEFRKVAEMEANAQLIAAAPELLSACKAIENAMLQTQGFTPNFLEQAIAKAEGRA